ncbi:MAG: hypothetical protein CVU42_08220 [Chloroflexi bacterium HGW-Chloroflexi-4]|jgi:hypothetical protein|nr:MAG: hypothetical protein CVU42_08220 [Chloroflexi bacterium HGW-Chloroflexi-4]
MTSNKLKNRLFISVALICIMVLSSCQKQQTIANNDKPQDYPPVPYDLISTDSIFSYLEDLTSIQPYSGWRNSASSGEAEGLDYVQSQLDQFSILKDKGLEVERQSFEVYSGVEFWTTEVHLTVNGEEIEVPADGIRGSRYDPKIALSLDSDGSANDSELNPVEAFGSILLIDNKEKLKSLKSSDVKGQILFLDYSLIDSVTNQDFVSNGQRVIKLIDNGLAGLVLITSYSNVDGESRGTMIGDGGIFQWFNHTKRIPILYVRIEDLSNAGISNWQDFEKVESARLVWDEDVFMPAASGNLSAHIEGIDNSKAVLLSAHIDSPNGPGAFDDGSGSAILLEIARVLNESKAQPAVDLYIVWYGGHELGTYGSSYFVSTHQDLMDKLLAMLVIDPVGMPMDGKVINISTSYSSYRYFGDDRSLWADYLSSDLPTHDIEFEQEKFDGLIADNSNYDAFNVPEFNLSVLDNDEWMAKGSGYGHYASHWHDPYETAELAKSVKDIFESITKIALSAALETGQNETSLKVTPKVEHHALVIASHTENPTIGPALMQDLGMALAWNGFDVDLIPYGQYVTAKDLENTEFVILLPALDYPGENEEIWSIDEITLLTNYINEGGLLLVTNSAHSIASGRKVEELNEDATSINDLLKPMGIEFRNGNLGGESYQPQENHALTANIQQLASMFENNRVPIKFTDGHELVKGVLGLVDYGQKGGQVIVITDIGFLKNIAASVQNLELVKNIADYAAAR